MFRLPGRILTAALAAAPAWAQCSMCRTAASAQGEHAMRAMNAAILVLLVPAVALFCGVYVLAIRGDGRPDSGKGE